MKPDAVYNHLEGNMLLRSIKKKQQKVKKKQTTKPISKTKTVRNITQEPPSINNLITKTLHTIPSESKIFLSSSQKTSLTGFAPKLVEQFTTLDILKSCFPCYTAKTEFLES